jgi:hypothetical protein
MPTETNFPATGTFSSLGNEGHEWALVLLFEGYNLAYTTHSDASGLQTAWAATSPWTVVKGGLEMPSGLRSDMSPFSSQISMEGMSLSIVDHDRTLAGLLEREASSAAVSERLALVTTASLDSNDTLILLNNSSAFPASGSAFVGGEELTYTANTFSGILAGVTRGVRSLFGTSSDADNFGRPHIIDHDTGVAPMVSTVPRMWVARGVALYLCTRIGGAWSAGLQGSGASTAAECLFAGRLQSYASDGAGRFTLELASIMERLKSTVLSRQFRAYLDEGVYFTAATDGHFRVRLDRRNSAGTLDRDAPDTVSLIATDGYYTHQEIAALINEQLNTWFDASGTIFPSTANLRLDLVGDRYEFSYTDTGANYTSNLAIDASEQMWTVLSGGTGWVPTLSNDRRTGEFPTILSLSFGNFDASETARRVAAGPPSDVAFTFSPDTGTYSLRVRDVTTGTEFVEQSAATFPPPFNGSATGWLKIGKALVPVSVAGTNVFTAYGRENGEAAGDLAHSLLGLTTIGSSRTVEGRDAVTAAFRDARTEQGTVVEQVWFEITSSPGDLMLKLMASTGTSAYNHATYDTLPLSMSLGLPWTLIDGDRFLQAFPFAGWLLYLDKPTPFLQLLETLLAVSNRRVVWRRGRITVVGFGEDASDTVALTEGNKAKQVTSADEPVYERSTVRRTMDYLINRVTLRHSFNHATGQWKSITVNGSDSQFDFGISKGVTVDGIGAHEALVGLAGVVDTWVSQVASTALAYFGRPLAIVERSFDVSLLGSLYPGCKVTIDDDGITDPVTGEAGVTGLRAWVLSVAFDLRSGVGRVACAFSPETAQTRHGLLPPSARVDETVSGGGYTNGYHAASKILAIKAHEYSGSSDSVDVSWFTAGRKVRVVSLSDYATSEMWADTVASIDTGTNRLTLTTGLAGFPATGTFVVEFDDIDNVLAAQRTGFAYLASSTTRSTGFADGDEYVYSGARQLHSQGSSTTVTYTNRHRKLAWTGEATITGGDAVGEAFSVHKLHETLDWANTALGYYTAQPVFQWTSTAQGGLDDGATGEILILGGTATDKYLLIGPVWVPLFGGSRTLRIIAYGNDGLIRVISSNGIVRGSGAVDNGLPRGFILWHGTDEPLIYPDGGVNVVEITMPEEPGDYSAEATLTPSVIPGEVPGCWLTVEGYFEGGDGTGYLHGIWIWEDALS